MTRPATEATELLAADVRAARLRLHMTTAIMASQIGISESALRRIENGTSHATRADTLRAIVAWAARRGYREFGGVNGATLIVTRSCISSQITVRAGSPPSSGG